MAGAVGGTTVAAGLAEDILHWWSGQRVSAGMADSECKHHHTTNSFVAVHMCTCIYTNVLTGDIDYAGMCYCFVCDKCLSARMPNIIIMCHSLTYAILEYSNFNL